MTVVVSDTSPLNYLVQIKCAQLLPALYEHILIPSMVLRELESAGTPAIMRHGGAVRIELRVFCACWRGIQAMTP